MKRIILIVLAVASLAGCGKMLITERNGVFIDNAKKIELRSAFDGGNDPSPDYSCNWVYIFPEKYSEDQDLTGIQYAVYIEGIETEGKEYKGHGDNICKITVNDLASVGDLVIPMNQGVYEGGNELVSSVKIVEYSNGAIDKDGNRVEPSRFIFEIGLVDGRTVVIRYVGVSFHDRRI